MESGVSTHNTAINVARLECESFDEFAEATGGWNLDWQQLDRGSLSAKLLQVATPSVLVTQFQFSRKFHQRGMSPPGMRTFGIVGAHSSPVEWNGRNGATNQIEVFPANDKYECVSHPDFHADGVSIPEDNIRSVADTLGLPNPLERFHDGPCFAVADPDLMSALRCSLTSLYESVVTHSGVSLSALAWSDLEFEIHSALVTALTSIRAVKSRSPDSNFRSRALRLALDYIDGHADDAPAVTDVCRESGASYRTLNYAFNERFGVTPKQYLQAVRLNGVRKNLRQLGPQSVIADIANDWGFWHMGRFASHYRRQFGELPSETLGLIHLSPR